MLNSIRRPFFISLGFIPALLIAQESQKTSQPKAQGVSVHINSEPKQSITPAEIKGQNQFDPSLSSASREALLTQAGVFISLGKLAEAETRLARLNSRSPATADWYIHNAALLLPIALDRQEKKRTTYAQEIALYIRSQLNQAEKIKLKNPEAEEAIARYRAVLAEKILGNSQEAAEEMKKAKRAETK